MQTGNVARNPLIRLFQIILSFLFTVCMMASALLAYGGAGMKAAQAAGLALIGLAGLSVTEFLTTGRWVRWQRR
ncbi:hypothetical protein AB0942_16595 [Streptomyces nodosus]|uniref:hypothetical protein n=1 Tax=Streptomyces nodosus TaxID=40318 RepID=UPI0034564F33